MKLKSLTLLGTALAVLPLTGLLLAAKSPKDAHRAMWICCWSCLPTWGYFMLVGTGLYVFYKVFPDPAAAEMLSGVRKAEGIVPFFVTTQLGPGFTGLVIAAVRWAGDLAFITSRSAGMAGLPT